MTHTSTRSDLKRTAASPEDGQPFPTPTRTPRLLLRTGGPRDVDGVWWPRTRNLTAELHDLITKLTPSLGAVASIRFGWNSVSMMQRRIDIDDGVEITGPETGQPGNVLRVYGRGGRHLDLVVVRPGLDTHYGYQLMRRVVDPSWARPPVHASAAVPEEHGRPPA
ncbi:DUF5994 family protein [Rhodococcus sp. AG1013]|uniref:DUF5994 family protein n=1 Tax=unclassified Rhodococcus (in: high G+C Gram-positive bacteria) TaxID=192944 RepID=UPI000E2A916D|nr:DUF5994 family protein [Rhodococcus sp. AG1013]RDI22571.1 hypothetical protein DEU38_113138 [Rhodococcus sp. AG1013]